MRIDGDAYRVEGDENGNKNKDSPKNQTSLANRFIDPVEPLKNLLVLGIIDPTDVILEGRAFDLTHNKRVILRLDRFDNKRCQKRILPDLLDGLRNDRVIASHPRDRGESAFGIAC